MSVAANLATQRAGLDASSVDLTGVTVRCMPPALVSVLGDGVDAITLDRTIYVVPDRYDEVSTGENPSLLLHELIHVAQWRQFGRLGFLAKYGSDYIYNRIIGLDHKIAYRAIPFEAQAYEGQSRSLPAAT